MLREIVLEVGSEGGSLTLLRERDADGAWQFRVERNETALYDMLSEDDRIGFGDYFARTGYVHSFHEALSLLDKYPWFHLYPLQVHPEFLDVVLREVRKRGGEAAELQWQEQLKRNDMNMPSHITWNQKVWDVIRNLYWTPRYVGFSSISKDKYPVDCNVPPALVAPGWRLYRRKRKVNDLLKYLSGQEEILNYFLNIAFAIAPDAVLSRLLCAPLDIVDAGPFETFGTEMALRYGWNENLTQPDMFLTSEKSLVGVELKLDSRSSPMQLAKYVALMAWEQEKTRRRRDTLGLLFIVPEKSLKLHWSKLGVDDCSGSDSPVEPSTIRRCPPNFFDKLIHAELPPRVRQLFESESGSIRGEIERLRLAAISWKWLRDEIISIESELDCSIRGDQTLQRLLGGLRSQIEEHENTGIS